METAVTFLFYFGIYAFFALAGRRLKRIVAIGLLIAAGLIQFLSLGFIGPLGPP